MVKEANGQVMREAPAKQPDASPVPADTKADFEAWLETLKPQQTIGHPRKESPPVEEPDFFISCTEGTDCRISFDGVLQIEGFLSANIHSDGGTLVTGHGLVDGNIEVGAAYIDSSVIGNITATEHVVLYSEARVAGNITAPALSTSPGALFEGDCVLEDSPTPRVVPMSNEIAGDFFDHFQI